MQAGAALQRSVGRPGPGKPPVPARAGTQHGVGRTAPDAVGRQRQDLVAVRRHHHAGQAGGAVGVAVVAQRGFHVGPAAVRGGGAGCDGDGVGLRQRGFGLQGVGALAGLAGAAGIAGGCRGQGQLLPVRHLARLHHHQAAQRVHGALRIAAGQGGARQQRVERRIAGRLRLQRQQVAARAGGIAGGQQLFALGPRRRRLGQRRPRAQPAGQQQGACPAPGRRLGGGQGVGHVN